MIAGRSWKWMAALALAALVPGAANARDRNRAPESAASGPGQQDGHTGAPARVAGEGEGPFTRLVIRGATLIDGSGAPPRGPVDIVIEGNRIAAIRSAGTPGLPLRPEREPRVFDREIDAAGMYVMPGIVDMHVHGSPDVKGPDLGYSYKLWLAHGVTTVRGVALAPYPLSAREKARSAANTIAAPRIFDYQVFGTGWGRGPVTTPEGAREWVRWARASGLDGIKFMLRTGDDNPAVFRAALHEAKALGLGSTAHLSQVGLARMNARAAGEAGLGTVTHFYGHLESLLKDNAFQDYSPGYNYADEQDRFGEVADIWDKTFAPGSDEWKAYLQQQKANNVTFDPTMSIYSASRDLMRAVNADWHDRYTSPELWQFYLSSRENHGSYFFDWTTRREAQWRRFYGRFMQLINDYKNIGGRVTLGTDSGFIFQTYGFSVPQEMEMLQEAGFSPLEVIQAATLNGALTLYEPKGVTDPPIGEVRVGKLADLVIVRENPLQNFKTLYGTGTPRLNETTQKLERVGGISFTIKDGIVYDAKRLLAEVAALVAAEKRKAGLPETGVPRP